MGVYINMEMPTDCGKCFVGDRTICQHNCPLVPVPPHGRLADIDKPIELHLKLDGVKSSVDVFGKIVLPADPAEEGET